MALVGANPLFLPNDIRGPRSAPPRIVWPRWPLLPDWSSNLDTLRSDRQFFWYFRGNCLKVFTRGHPTKNVVIPFNSGGDCLLGKGCHKHPTNVMSVTFNLFNLCKGFHAQESKNTWEANAIFWGGTNYVRIRKYTHCRPANIEEDRGQSLY